MALCGLSSPGRQCRSRLGVVIHCAGFRIRPLERAFEHPVRGGLVGLLAEGHRAEADRRHAQLAATERDKGRVFHGERVYARPRATLIALFLFTDLYALAWSALVSIGTEAPTPLLGSDTLRWALWLAPAMLAGIWVGQRSFAGVSPAQFRRHVLNLLMLIATISVLRALVDLFGS